MGNKKHAVGQSLHEAAGSERELGTSLKMERRLALAAHSSERLSEVFTVSPAQALRFRRGVQLASLDAGRTPGFDGSKNQGLRFIDLSTQDIAYYQRLMYANGVAGGKRRLLIVLQGMDASGKGGIVEHVFRQVNPMGIHYHGFGKPSEEELSHDFLWRIRKELPADGWISIFDRSQYEDIVMPHVWGTYPRDVWQARYEQVNEFEGQLVDDGCAIIKIYLVSSKAAQKRHFLGRLDDPEKYWKFDPSDLDARDHWDEYIEAWQDVFEHTDSDRAPWYLVPADHRWYSRVVVSELLRNALRAMDLAWPPLDGDRRQVIERLACD